MNTKKFFKKNCIKIVVSIVIIFIAVVCINYLQDKVSEWRQNSTSENMLQEVSKTIDSNKVTAKQLEDTYHQCNREILNDLKQMMQDRTTVDSLATTQTTSTNNGKTTTTTKATTTVVVNGSAKLNGLVESDFAPYLFVVDSQGNVTNSADSSFVGTNLCTTKFFTEANFKQLLTCPNDGVLSTPDGSDDDYYFYATSMDPAIPDTYLIIGFDNDTLKDRVNSLTSLDTIIKNVNLSSGECVLAVKKNNGTITYCSNSNLGLSGKTTADAGISDNLLVNQAEGTITINGEDYMCSSVENSDDTVLIMAVSYSERFANNYKPTVWAVAILVMVLIVAVHYIMLIPGSLERAKKKQRVVSLFNSKYVINMTAAAKVLPLLALGLVLVFGSTFYCRTIIKLSWAMDDVERPLSQLQTLLEENEETKKEVDDYCDHMYLSEAQMLANMIEVDPSCLNEATTKTYEVFNASGVKQVIADNEGNPLKSVPDSSALEKLCENNGVTAIQIFNDQGYLISSSNDTWNFQLSHDSDDQSSEFYDVVLGKVDYLVQDPQTDDDGNYNQYIGVAFNYYTTKADDGSTYYVSRLDYKNYLNGDWSGNPITAHQSVLQCCVDMSIRQEMMESLDVTYIMEHVALENDAYIVVFDDSADHNIIYTPNTQNIGKSASDLNVSDDEFSGDFNGFQTVAGVEYYECCRYENGYYVALATPTDSLFANRLQSSVLVTLASFIAMILIMLMFLVMPKEDMTWLRTKAGSIAPPESSANANGEYVLGGSHSFATWRYNFSRKTAEEKITFMLRIFCLFVGLYFVLGFIFGGLLFADSSVITYIFTGDWERGLNIFAFTKAIVVLAVVIVAVEAVNWFVHRVFSVFSSNAVTIANLLMSLLRYVAVIAALFYCLYLFGIDAMSLLVSAGLLTLIIGLGAQDLIKDMLASIFIIFEGYYHVGDFIVFEKQPGYVTEIGIRTTKIRNLDNSITICNNSEITQIVSMSVKDYILKLRFNIAACESLERVEAILKQELPHFKEKIPQLIDDPAYKGVVEFDDCTVELLINFKCKGQDYRKVLHAVYREFKLLYEKHGILAPYNLEIVANGGSLEELANLQGMSASAEEETDIVVDEKSY